MSKDCAMYDKRIVNSAKFLKLSATAKLLYLYMLGDADTDGIVDAYVTMNKLNSSPGDLEVLVNNGFAIILNENQVTYLPDYLKHNPGLDARWLKRSIYLPLLAKVVPNARIATTVLRTYKKGNKEEHRVVKIIVTAADIMSQNTIEVRPLNISCETHENSCETHVKDKLSKDNLNEDKSSSARCIERETIKNILKNIGVKEPKLAQLLMSENLLPLPMIIKYSVEAKKKDNPAGWIIKAIEDKFPRSIQPGRHYDPNCPKCHGTGTVKYNPVGLSDVLCTLDCDCYKNYKP